MNIKTLFALIAVSTIAFVVPATYAKTPRRSSEVQESNKVWHLTRENWGAVNIDAFTEFLVALNNNDTHAGRQLLDKNLIVQFPAGTNVHSRPFRAFRHRFSNSPPSLLGTTFTTRC